MWNHVPSVYNIPSEVPRCHIGQNPVLPKHIHNTKMKVATRNNLLKKWSNSKWDCNARTIRTTALALSYTAAEYGCRVWARSPHASKLDPELNDACRSITGCLRPINVEELYLLAGLHHLTSEEMYVLEWKIRNRKQTQLTLYTVRFQRRDAWRENASLAPYDLLTSLQK